MDGALVLRPRPWRSTHPRSHGEPGRVSLVFLFRSGFEARRHRGVQYDERRGSRAGVTGQDDGRSAESARTLIAARPFFDTNRGDLMMVWRLGTFRLGATPIEGARWRYRSRCPRSCSRPWGTTRGAS